MLKYKIVFSTLILTSLCIAEENSQKEINSDTDSINTDVNTNEVSPETMAALHAMAQAQERAAQYKDNLLKEP